MGPGSGGKRRREEPEVLEGLERPVVFLSSSSSDDEEEEANLDLSLEIVERAKKNNDKRRALELSGERVPVVVELSSSDGVEAASERRKEAPPAATVPVGGATKKRKTKRKKKKQIKDFAEECAVRGGPETADVDVVKNEEEPMGITSFVVTELNEDMPDNIVLRKLLRGPRYFDPGSSHVQSCYNCGEEGHVVANCTAEKRKKPCFVCGMFGHNANKCSQGQDCFICKRRGHFAKDCPDKHRRTAQDNRICLRCGDMGHDMISCGNAYPTDDLKEIQCYVCKGFGHFCCIDFIDTAPAEISCYNCGDSGHSGVGCAKPRGETSGVASPTLCFICGEEGHFARGCTRKSKFNLRSSELSTPTPKSSKSRTTPRYSKDRKDYWESRSMLHDTGMGSKSVPHSKELKKRSMQYEGRTWRSCRKSRVKGGWIVDDPGDWSKRDRDTKPWKSPKNKSWKSPSTPRTPVRKSYKNYDSAGSWHRHHVY